MAKILNSTTMNGAIAKMIELPDEYIINGQVYDKTTFAPKPLDFCPVTATGNMNDSAWYRNLSIGNTGYGVNRINNGIIVDSNDPSISYVILQPKWNEGYHYSNIVRFRRLSTGLEATALQNGSYGFMMEFISQTSDRIYCIANTENDSDRFPQIFSINKATFAVELAADLGWGRVRVIKDTPGFIYFAVAGGKAGTQNYFNVQKYNKTTGALTTLLTDNKNGFRMWTFISDPTQAGQVVTFYAARDAFYKDTTVGYHSNCFRKYQLDLTTESVTVSDVNTDVSILGSQVFAIVENDTMAAAYELLPFTDNGKNYMSLAVYNYGAGAYLNLARCALWTFQMTDADNWKLVSYKKFSPYLIKGMMPLFNNKMLIFAEENNVFFYNWNTATQAFELTSQFPMAVRAVGADMNNNIWIQRTDKSVEMMSNTIPVDIYADFIQDDYQYDGTEINTVIEVFARNYTNQYITSSLQLTLTGPVKFTDTGLKTKTVTTSNLNKITVPVTVTGPGLLNVNPKLI